MLFVTGFWARWAWLFANGSSMAWAPTGAANGPGPEDIFLHSPAAFLVGADQLLWFYRFSLSSAQDPAWDRLAAVAAEVGLLFCGLALVTGCLWAKRSWGVWWTWDPRLTTTIVLWFVYAGYLVLRGLEMGSARKRLTCAVVGIVAFLMCRLFYLCPHLAFDTPGRFRIPGRRPAPGNENLRHLLRCGNGLYLVDNCLPAQKAA